jgi:hypothetical protein
LKDVRETFFIAGIRSEGTAEDVKELERLLQWETEKGERMPSIIIGRLNGTKTSQWFRENTKAYQTPTILNNWKKSFPAPVAVCFFHECDVCAIDEALYLDFDKSVGEKILSKNIIATCYAYLYLTGSCPGVQRGIWHQGKKVFEEKGSIMQTK